MSAWAWTGAARAREPEKNALSNAIERADGEWCTLEMNNVALLPRETWKLCLGRGPDLPAEKGNPGPVDKLACCLLRLAQAAQP